MRVRFIRVRVRVNVTVRVWVGERVREGGADGWQGETPCDTQH